MESSTAPRRIVGYEYCEWSHGGKGVPWRVNQLEFDQLRLDGWNIVIICDSFTLLERPKYEEVAMSKIDNCCCTITPVCELSGRETENEIFFADFPHELEMDKYTLRDWLIGYAVRHGWTYCRLDRLSLDLVKDGVRVLVQIRPGGLTLSAGERREVLETRG